MLPTKAGRGRKLVRRALRVSLALLAAAALVACAVSRCRLALASCAARHALDRAGLADATFELVRLSPGCLVLENIRLGAPEPLLTVARAEVRFTTPDVARGAVDQVRVRGVSTPAVIEGGRLRLPLQARLQALASAGGAQAGAGPALGAAALPVLGELSVYDVQVPVRLSNGAEVVTLKADATLLSEPEARGAPAGSRYRFSLRAGDGGGVQARADGSLDVATGALSLAGELKVADAARVVERARLAAPDALSALRATLTNVSLSARGTVAVSGWTNAGAFEVAAELGRGSALELREHDAFVRFQSLRVEASGTPQDVQARLSVGISALRVGGQIQASQEEGRLVGLRATGRCRQTATNRTVRASLDSDLPGRTAVQLLSGVLPLLPRLMTDGGTLHAEAELAQAVGCSDWTGEARATAEARRSALSLPAGGRAGAGRVAISCRLPVDGSKPGTLRTDVALEEGYFVKPGLSARGGGRLSLLAQPPYDEAVGEFSAQVSETAATAKAGVDVQGGSLRLEGGVAVAGLTSNPVWQVALRAPAFGVGGKAGPADWRAKAEASARVRYGAEHVELEGDARVSDFTLGMDVSNVVRRVDAGVGVIDARFSLPGGVTPAALPEAELRAHLAASNGWVRAGDLARLEDARLAVPLVCSAKRGVVFTGAPALSWRAFDAGGLRLLPERASLSGGLESLGGRLDGRVDGSALSVAASLRVPFADPLQCEIGVEVPEARLEEDDPAFAALAKVDAEVRVSGRVSAQAQIRFPAKQPQAQGVARLADVTVKKGAQEVSGLCAEVPFLSDAAFRTRGRPYVAFASARVGNVRLDKGKMEFQVTPDELFMDRFEVGWCKGSLNAYSVHADTKDLRADVVVYADRIDLGEALMMVVPFQGRMEGVLYGRFPVGVDKARVKLSTGFLYSLPGQGGKLRLDDHGPMSELLARAGVVGDVQAPLAKALSDLDFRSIRMELEPKAGGDAVFRIKLDGKSNYKEWPAPVDLNLNLHGPLEELLNLGLDVSRK